MGKIPTIAIVAIVAVLVIGMSVASFYFLIKPKQAELKATNDELQKQQGIAAQRTTAEQQLAQATSLWLQSQAQLTAISERKSIHISMYMPLVAMTAIWYEYRDQLPAVVQKYFQGQGVTIENGASIPAPPLAPPTVPANGFMQVPAGQTINLTVTGAMANLERVYRNLAQLPRVATIGALKLSGSGDNLTADIPLSLYILVEGAEAAAPPPAPAPTAGATAAGPGVGPPSGPGGGAGKASEEGGDSSASSKGAKDASEE